VSAGNGQPPPRPPRPLGPLEMARNCVRSVLQYADYQGRDPLGSYVARSGQAGHQAAQLAGNMALVSIAEDMHRIVAIMTGDVALLEPPVKERRGRGDADQGSVTRDREDTPGTPPGHD
jgi:hypothetical protein